MKKIKLLLSGVVAMMVAAGALASHNGIIHGSQQSVPRPKPFVVHPLSPTRPR